MKKYVFKPFETPGGKYVYDRSVDTFFQVTPQEYEEFLSVESGQLDADSSQAVKKYQIAGYLRENCVKCIEHPELKFLRYYLDRHIQYITLQVTQNCNLRCEYCIYSGAYAHQRTHSSKRMSWETAKQAIDFFLKHSVDTKELSFGFYGGEPLLEIDLIKKCVEYIESQVQSKPVRYFITTNGTLLTEPNFEFMARHNFRVLISLDGNEAEHDRHRKFASNGEGSFHVIMENVKRLKEKYPREAEKIHFNAVITPESDLACVLEFFSTDEVMSDNHVMFNNVVSGRKDAPDAEKTFWTVRYYEYLKYLLALMGRISMKKVSPMAQRSFHSMFLAYDQMRRHTMLGTCCHPNGPCIPGSTKLFVATDGTLYPCQNVSETSDYFRIGSLQEGLCYDKIARIMNNGALTAEDCKDCWMLHLCSICSQQIEHEGETITRQDKLNLCKSREAGILMHLKTIAALGEFGCDMKERGGA